MNNFSGRGQNMVSSQKWALFFSPKSRFLAQISDICHTTPILVNSPFVALGETVHFPPWERFFDFRSPVTAVFVKEIQLIHQKLFPLPNVRASSASNSLSTLSAQAPLSGLVRKRVGHWTILRAVATPVPDSKSNPIQRAGPSVWPERFARGLDKNVDLWSPNSVRHAKCSWSSFIWKGIKLEAVYPASFLLSAAMRSALVNWEW